MKCLNFCFNDIDKLQKRIFYVSCYVYPKKFALTDYKDVFLNFAKSYNFLLNIFFLEILMYQLVFLKVWWIFLPIYKNNNDIIVFINYLAKAEWHNIQFF